MDTQSGSTSVCASVPGSFRLGWCCGFVRVTYFALVMAITEVPQSRSAKFPTLGVLVSLAGVSFRSVFSGLGLVGA